MPVTPQITLTANLETILGAQALGYLRITLCGSGPVMPAVPGTAMLADATIPRIIGPQIAGTPISVTLYGNDVIVPGPDVTFYEIAVLDANQNVVQTGNYRFDGVLAIDLSQAAQIVAPYGFPLGQLKMVKCTGAVPGTHYAAPGGQLVVAVFLNQGVLTPGDDWSASGAAITLTFATELNDEILALCVHP